MKVVAEMVVKVLVSKRVVVEVERWRFFLETVTMAGKTRVLAESGFSLKTARSKLNEARVNNVNRAKSTPILGGTFAIRSHATS